jgi:hypothetical protein
MMVEQDGRRPWDSSVLQKGNEGEPDVGVLKERNRPMVGYMSLEEQVDKDFSLARRKALLGRVGARLRRDNASEWLLLCFDDLGKIPRGSGENPSRHEDGAAEPDRGLRRPLF